MKAFFVVVCLIAIPAGVAAQAASTTPDAAALHHSVEQLRTSIGRWHTVTRFLDPEGSVARSVEGTYEFRSGPLDVPTHRGGCVNRPAGGVDDPAVFFATRDKAIRWLSG